MNGRPGFFALFAALRTDLRPGSIRQPNRGIPSLPKRGGHQMNNLLVLVVVLLTSAGAAYGQTTNKVDKALEAKIIAPSRSLR
jgi:hypothetical protein